MRAGHWRSLPSTVRVPIGLGAFAIGYFTIASLTMIRFGVSTPIWFANAFAISLIVQQSPARWPVMLGLLYAADVAAIHVFADGPAPLTAVADLIETAVAALLIRKIGGPQAALSSVTRLTAFVFLCVSVPVLSAAWGAGVLYFSVGAPLAESFVNWYSASSLGLLVAGPIFLIWFTRALRESAGTLDRRMLVILLVALALLAWVVTNGEEPSYLLLTFPALLMLVWRGELLGASMGSALLVVIGLWSTLSGEGAFVALSVHPEDASEHIEALQVYLAALTLSSLPLAVVLADQRRLARELARVADVRSEFLAAMSHEIRTPMTGMLGMVDLLEAEAPSPRQRVQLGAIRSSGRHLLAIINDVLDFSRIETGVIELERIDFSLPELLEQVQSVLHSLAADRGIRLAVGLGERSPPVIKGDPTRVKQILINLAGNAIKFTPAGSVIVLAAHRPEAPGHRFRFEVRDTGIGISEENLPHIFTAFTQADNSTKRRYGGSGLGLAISKRLVDAMNGEIGVESTLGEGSLFWFEVPFEPGNPVNLPVAQAARNLPVEPRRVLLAEDVELNRDIIRTVLERDGHTVVIAENGSEAVERVQAEAFDLILMDVHMPVMDGLEATRAIRALAGVEARIPIIALTANVMASEQEKCRHAGMNAVLMKPIDWEQVRSAIREHSGTSSATGVANEGCGASEDDCGSAFDEAVFAGLVAVIGAERLTQHGVTLKAEVRALATSQPGDDPDPIAAAAHKIVSQAGMFGLMRISTRAGEVEDACRAHHGLAEALDRFREAAADLDDQLFERLSSPPIASTG